MLPVFFVYNLISVNYFEREKLLTKHKKIKCFSYFLDNFTLIIKQAIVDTYNFSGCSQHFGLFVVLNLISFLNTNLFIETLVIVKLFLGGIMALHCHHLALICH